jgi:hypothetical protein
MLGFKTATTTCLPAGRLLTATIFFLLHLLVVRFSIPCSNRN